MEQEQASGRERMMRKQTMSATTLHSVGHQFAVAGISASFLVITACTEVHQGFEVPPFVAVGRSNDDGTIRYGYIDSTGQVRIKPQFAEASAFSDGLARVRLASGQWGYIDQTGKVVITLPKEVAYSATFFHEGRALANLGGEAGEIDDHSVYGGTWGYIDRTGGFAVPPRFTIDHFKQFGHYTSWGFFRNGRALVPVEGGWGYIDLNGALVIPGPFTRAYPFLNGVAETHLSFQISENLSGGITRFIDVNGRVLWED